jgi:hypothetical protein
MVATKSEAIKSFTKLRKFMPLGAAAAQLGGASGMYRYRVATGPSN